MKTKRVYGRIYRLLREDEKILNTDRSTCWRHGWGLCGSARGGETVGEYINRSTPCADLTCWRELDPLIGAMVRAKEKAEK